jgi:tetratricopeptide (TPR) repeat protein
LSINKIILSFLTIGFLGACQTPPQLSTENLSTPQAVSSLSPPLSQEESREDQLSDQTPSLPIAAGDFLAGRFADNHHDAHTASETLHSALRANPTNVELQHRLMMSLASEGRFAESSYIGKILLGRPEDRLLPGLVVIEQLAKEGKWDEVLALEQSLKQKENNNPILFLIEAWSLMGLGRQEEAIQSLNVLAGDGIAALQRALLNNLAGHREAASRAYQEALSNPGGLTFLTLISALDFYRSHDDQQMVKKIMSHNLSSQLLYDFDLEPIEHDNLAHSPQEGLAIAYFILAESLKQNQDEQLPLSFYRMVVDLSPGFMLGHFSLAEELRRQGYFDESIIQLVTIGEKSPFYWSSKIALAQIENSRKNVNKALSLLNEVIHHSSSLALDPLLMAGDMLSEDKQWLKALDYFNKAILLVHQENKNENEILSRYWTIYFARGIAYERSHQWTLAEADLRKVLTVQPENPDILNYLGYSLVDHQQHLEEARKLLQKAVSLKPQDGNIVDSLGWAYYQSGLYDQAVLSLRKAVELKPADALINTHFGDALWRNGRHEEAKFQWSHALQDSPEPELRRDIEKRLKSGLPLVHTKASDPTEPR